LADTEHERRQAWAFNFIQIPSEIAPHHPELLVLVVSTRNGNPGAFQQIQRLNAITGDFAASRARCSIAARALTW
jgi:hypothetical protein